MLSFDLFIAAMFPKVLVKNLQSLFNRNGLCQDCSVVPVLFSLYFGVVVYDWKSKCSSAGVEFRYKPGHKQVGDVTAKSQ